MQEILLHNLCFPSIEVEPNSRIISQSSVQNSVFIRLLVVSRKGMSLHTYCNLLFYAHLLNLNICKHSPVPLAHDKLCSRKREHENMHKDNQVVFGRSLFAHKTALFICIVMCAFPSLPVHYQH